MDINAVIQNVMQMKASGKNPQTVLQTMLQQNPNLKNQLQMLRNMAGDRTPQEFYTQLAKQQGASLQSIQAIQSLFSK